MYFTIMQRCYAGIGSRKTPKDILKLMEKIGEKLAKNGWILRSGGAIGADTAFENGAKKVNDLAEIYTPENFDKSKENIAFCDSYLLPIIDKGRDFKKFGYGTKLLLRRNVHQILGKPIATPCSLNSLKEVCGLDNNWINVNDLNPVKFVIFWMPTEDIWDENGGGTRYAVRIADKLNIPLFNLKNEKDKKRLEEWLENIKK